MSEKGLRPGSVYDQVYKLIRDSPGITTRAISQQLSLTIEDASKRCFRLSERGYTVKRPISAKVKRAKIVSDMGWYIINDAPDDAYAVRSDDILYLYDKEDSLKKHEYACFKLKEMFSLFGKITIEGNKDRSARISIKDYVKIIDSVYGSQFPIQTHYSVKITYIPVVGTMKDIYKIAFQLFFDTTPLGYIRKIRLDLEATTFYFDIENVSFCIRFTTLQQAYSKWMKMHNTLRKKFIERYENNLLQFDDVEEIHEEISTNLLGDVFESE